MDHHAYAVLIPNPDNGRWEIYSGPFETKEKAEDYATNRWGVPRPPILIMQEVGFFEERKEDK